VKLSLVLLPSLALGGAALLLGPAPTSEGYSLIGDSLGLSQRDFRVYNNFSKAITNDNVTPDDNFPGFDGAEMAIWKGCIEWGSGLHGSGNGDPTQPGDLGSGGANFDPSFQGNSSSIGSSSNNVHSQISGSSGGVLAYCEGGFFTSAWRIRYYESWDWDDGPGAPGIGNVDLQGIACHEYGHALGLGHSAVGGATMVPSATGSGAAQRSIHPDDVAGVQAIYGAAASTKPRIFSIEVSGNTLTIHGEDFSGTNNQAWFTNANTTSGGADPFVKVGGLLSSGGGTQIVVTIPANAGPGDLLVQTSGSTNSSLSNAWPFDPAGNPPAPVITGISPQSAPAVNPTAPTITVSGNGLETVVEVRFDGAPVEHALTAAHELTFPMPTPSALGPVTVAVETLYGTGQTSIDIVPNDPPALVCDTPLVVVGQPAGFTIGALPGSIAFLASSPNQIPSILPGVISADIGAGFTTLTLVASPAIDASGTAESTFPTAGLPPLSVLYFQVAAFDGTFPMSVSGVVQLITF
jgi:hypothetical protein